VQDIRTERSDMYQKIMNNITSGMLQSTSNKLSLPSEIEPVITAIVRRLEALLEDGTYRELVEQVLRTEGMSQYPVYSEELINIIPGNQTAACTRISLAVAMGSASTSSIGFPSVMRSVREHMIDCERMNRAVVLITDTWNPKQIEDHILDIRAHQRKGRFIVPHIVAGSNIHRVDWPSYYL
jgi:hypothetical protein